MLGRLRRSAATVGVLGYMVLGYMALGTAPATAQDSGGSPFEGTEVVPRIGVTLGPEQVILGVGFIMAGIADITHLEARPGVDLGFGDNQTTLRANANIGYSVPTSGGDVRVTPEVGIALFYSSSDFDPGDGQPRRSTSDTSLGVNIGAAAQAGDLIFEALVGLGDVADISITVGIGVG